MSSHDSLMVASGITTVLDAVAIGDVRDGGSYEARTIRIEARHPVAYVRRSLAIRDFLLAPNGR